MADTQHPFDDNDNGYASRKWRGLLIFWLVVSAGYAATIIAESAAAEYATFGGLLLAGLGMYYGVNGFSKWTVRSKKGLSMGQDFLESEEAPQTVKRASTEAEPVPTVTPEPLRRT